MKEQKQRWIAVCFIMASGLIIFLNLWGRSLENHDYLRYAEVAREMIRSGEWVVPRYNGEVYLDKPPLLFWLIAIPSWFYGSVTPMIARFPCALSAWIGVVILFLWGKRIYGTGQAGLISGGILLTSYQYFFQARIAKTDMLLCLMILLSLYFFYVGYDGCRRKPFLSYGLSFFFMGLGVLTKGPFGIAIPILVVIAFLLKEKRIKLLISKEFLLGYVILAMTVLPWIVLFIKSVGWEQTVALVKANQILTRKAPIYFYFIEIWVQFFPWSLLLPFLFLSLWRKRGDLQSGESLLLLWFVLLFILLTLFKYRVSRYLLPALPPLALMMGGMGRKKAATFLIPFCLFVLIWHGVEVYWLRNNISHSPGMVLAGELRPLLDGSTLSGYRLDVSTVEEINFYLDRVIPVLKKADPLSGKKWVLMPEEVFHGLRARGNESLLLIREFQYKDGRLVLVSS